MASPTHPTLRVTTKNIARNTPPRIIVGPRSLTASIPPMVATRAITAESNRRGRGNFRKLTRSRWYRSLDARRPSSTAMNSTAPSFASSMGWITSPPTSRFTFWSDCPGASPNTAIVANIASTTPARGQRIFGTQSPGSSGDSSTPAPTMHAMSTPLANAGPGHERANGLPYPSCTQRPSANAIASAGSSSGVGTWVPRRRLATARAPISTAMAAPHSTCAVCPAARTPATSRPEPTSPRRLAAASTPSIAYDAPSAPMTPMSASKPSSMRRGIMALAVPREGVRGALAGPRPRGPTQTRTRGSP